MSGNILHKLAYYQLSKKIVRKYQEKKYKLEDDVYINQRKIV